MITFIIDKLTPCLKNCKTGDIIETEVVRLKRKSFLSKFNTKTGWYINWSKCPEEVEIYALVLKGTMDIQGLIGIQKIMELQVVHIHWACVSPTNNIWEYGTKEYEGVGGHLFAIAGKKSMEYGYGGFVYGEAMDKEILEHYVSQYNAEKFPFGYPTHPYRFSIDGESMSKIVEVYSYDDTGEEI